MATTDCFACGATISGEDVDVFEDAFLVHIRTDHPDLPYPDRAVKNFAAATQRLSDDTERRDRVGAIVIEPVSPARVGDWLELFDHTGFAGNPAWASCYCTEPHLVAPDGSANDDDPRWSDRRAAMLTLLGNGTAFGYLAYVEDTVAGWVNASLRSSYKLYECGSTADPPDARVVGISCFVIAPPYRRHGLASALLDRVIAEAGERGATHVEAYPFLERNEDHFISPDAGEFRGPRAMFEERGFEEIERRERDAVLRRAI